MVGSRSSKPADDFMPGGPPWAVGVGAGILAFCMTGLLVQGVGAVFWVMLRVATGNDDPFSTWPAWLYVTVGIVLYAGILAAAIGAGRRAARWASERRSGRTALEGHRESD